MVATVGLASRVGVGTYRMALGNAAHEEAMSLALRSGIHVIDTAPNYWNGMSESLVGQAISAADAPDRSTLSLISKFGFIQGKELEAHRTLPFQDASHVSDYASHSIHPAFMQQQLSSSLKRLNTSYLDKYLVHNPEHALMAALEPTTTDIGKIYEARAQLMENLKESFVALEEQVAAGRILKYGLSTNSVNLPDSHPHALPLRELPALAAEAAKIVGRDTHSFDTLQVPANLIERQVLSGQIEIELQNDNNNNNNNNNKNSSSNQQTTLADWAVEQDINLVVNRPLSGFDDQGSWRLAERPFPSEYSVARDGLVERFSLDEPSQSELADMSPDDRTDMTDTLEACAWFRQLIKDLDNQIGDFTSVMHYQEDLGRNIVTAINSKVDGMDDETAELVHNYLTLYGEAVRCVSGARARAKVGEMNTKLGLPIPPPNEPLDQYAVRWLLGHDAVSTVLVGLTRPNYVDAMAHAMRG